MLIKSTGWRRVYSTNQKQLEQIPLTLSCLGFSYFWILTLSCLQPLSPCFFPLSFLFLRILSRAGGLLFFFQHKSPLTGTRQQSAVRRHRSRAPTVCLKRCSWSLGNTFLHKGSPQRWLPLPSGVILWSSHRTREGSGSVLPCLRVSLPSNLWASRMRAATLACTACILVGLRAPRCASPPMVIIIIKW